MIVDMLYMILNARLLRSKIFIKLLLTETRIQVGERLMHQWRRVKLIQSSKKGGGRV